MANNYFGFTHGATQYSAQPATAYPTAQAAYVQPAAAQAAYATAAPRAQAYEAYPTAQPVGQYAYAARAPAAATYDATKAYYTSGAAAPVAATATVYTIAEAPYQAAKPVYATTYSTPSQPRPVPAKVPAVSQATSSAYVYPNTSSAAPVTTACSYSGGYDAALYSAASSYYQQQQAVKTGATWQFKKGQPLKSRLKQPPKQPQLHYCDICKISCAGPQTYREHLEGQKHKKKEAAAKSSAPQPTVRGNTNQKRCELCDVACTGTDAYAAHIRGAKHQKVVKLHTKLGKPIPSTDPVVAPTLAPPKSSAPTVNNSTQQTAKVSKPSVKKVVGVSKINFVGGAPLKMGQNVQNNTVKVEPSSPEPANHDVEREDDKSMVVDKDVVPVGTEYIEEVKNEAGKTVSFNCKLCECKFNDPNAKEMHMKGRRHRLQYKKKVDPSLQVEVKPSVRVRKMQEEKLHRQSSKEEFWRRHDEERWREEMRYMTMVEQEKLFWNRNGPGGDFNRNFSMRRPDTSDDRHVMAKHAAIYPDETELHAVQAIVSTCEKALKMASDYIAEKDDSVRKKEKKETEDTEESGKASRSLKGVMRVGVLAKGLLLHGDLNVHLVLLCSEKPTRTLMEQVADCLPAQLELASDQAYDVALCVEKAAIVIKNKTEPKTSCTVTLTSPLMRENLLPDADSRPVIPDPPDVLDKSKCIEALAALRHAKWFQARATGLQSCVIIIRILRDLALRNPTWAPMSQWAQELLTEKCVSSSIGPLNPGDALRRVFECVASGILLSSGPGLYDPCEKEPTDATANMTSQEKEDITASAQFALRMIAFRQIYKVLDMEQLTVNKFVRNNSRLVNPRKRRRTNSAGEDGESPDGDGKKDKREEKLEKSND